MKYLGILAILLCTDAYSEQATQAVGYTLTPNESKIFDFLLADDAQAFAEGKGVLIASDMPRVSIDDITKTYEENQVAGDQKYFKKKMIVTGTISAIKSGMGNEPYLSMAGPGIFSGTIVKFERPAADIERIAKLKKGQKISMVCNGAGVILSSPTLDSCRFADDYAWEEVAKFKAEFAKFIAGGETKNKLAMGFAPVSMSMAALLSPTSACFSTPNANKNESTKCKQEIAKVFSNKKAFNSKIDESIETLKKAGIKIKRKDAQAENDKGAAHE